MSIYVHWLNSYLLHLLNTDLRKIYPSTNFCYITFDLLSFLSKISLHSHHVNSVHLSYPWNILSYKSVLFASSIFLVVHHNTKLFFCLFYCITYTSKIIDVRFSLFVNTSRSQYIAVCLFYCMEGWFDLIHIWHLCLHFQTIFDLSMSASEFLQNSEVDIVNLVCQQHISYSCLDFTTWAIFWNFFDYIV